MKPPVEVDPGGRGAALGLLFFERVLRFLVFFRRSVRMVVFVFVLVLVVFIIFNCLLGC